MNHDKALINYLFNHFSMHASRITIMFEMILSLIKVGNVQQQKLAQGTSVKAKVSSITRRIQRFFAQEFLDQDRVSALIFSMFDWHDKITLTLDRTNWKFGVVDINFLVICGIYKGYSIPLSWTILPHSGNSDTTCRINLLERFLEVVPLNRVGFLLADREFIGSDWFRYLQERGIPFCIRLKENMLVSDTYRGGVIKLKSLFRHVWSGRTREIGQVVKGVYLRIFGTRMTTGELLIIALSQGTDDIDPFELYGQRWTIETMFKAFKTAGFNFEDTHQKHLDRLSKMMALLTIAYAWSIHIGAIKSSIKPIKNKLHGRPAFSLFSYGFQVIQTILLRGGKYRNRLIGLLAKITLNKPFSRSDANVTVVY